MRTGGTLRQFPFVAEQVREEIIAPLRRRRGPNDFQAAADGVPAFARSKFAFPAEALLLDAGGFRFRAHQFRIASPVGFAKSVTAGYERNGLLVIHRHARESLSDIACRCDGIRLSI